MKKDDRQLKKVLHEPMALYLTLTYNTLVSLVQGFVLGAIFYIISIQQNIDILIICNMVICFLMAVFVWHNYIVHNQFIVIRASIFDTLIPITLGITQSLLALAIPKPIYIFTFILIFVVVILIFSLLNVFIKNNDPAALEVFKEHLKEQGPEFAEDLYEEIRNFEKQSMSNAGYIVIFFSILTAFNYFMPLSMEIKTYISTIVTGFLIIQMYRYDLNYYLNRSKKLEKYGYKW
ncbi:MAG: hypothetical protein FJ150_10055 [Euryarchaeota archaeon]|nr:hypothetical protein [Euryarchaeota archaeon]